MSPADFWRDQKINEVSQGRAAAHYVAYVLTGNGLSTSFALQSGYDLIVTKDDQVFKVQVKSTKAPQTDRPNRVAVKLGKYDYLSDVFAFVYLKRQTVIFKKTHEIKHLKKWSLPCDFFTEKNMMATLTECFHAEHNSR